jgi:choline dehydrogenase-like flavoprotein
VLGPLSTNLTGVIDQNGETWECNDLYIMDASTFPTASGANPMMTVLSVSHMLTKKLVSRLGLKIGDINE